LLFEVLKFYPLIPPEQCQFTSAAPDPSLESARKLLEESLAEDKTKNRQALESLLSQEGKFQEDEAGYQLRLSCAEVEWLLQVLNEIRVGSWRLLGSPEPRAGKQMKLNERTAPYFWAMELCAYFEFGLLAALEGRG
jgi:hypothetical protein